MVKQFGIVRCLEDFDKTSEYNFVNIAMYVGSYFMPLV